MHSLTDSWVARRIDVVWCGLSLLCFWLTFDDNDDDDDDNH